MLGLPVLAGLHGGQDDPRPLRETTTGTKAHLIHTTFAIPSRVNPNLPFLSTASLGTTLSSHQNGKSC